jgi:hypothetical protein
MSGDIGLTLSNGVLGLFHQSGFGWLTVERQSESEDGPRSVRAVLCPDATAVGFHNCSTDCQT